MNQILAVARSRTFWSSPIPRFVLLFILANVLVAHWHRILVREREANLLHRSHQTGSEVHYDISTGEHLEAYMKEVPDARRAPLVALSGMSQTYAINDEKPGDQTISDWLDASLRQRGLRAFGFPAPNLDNEEALLILLTIASEPATRPRLFIYGLCFDKFRNVDLRPGYQNLFTEYPKLKQAWSDVIARYEWRFPLAVAKMKQSLSDATKNTKSDEDTFEGRLREAVAKRVPIVAAREALNAFAQNSIFLLRNFVFHIKPTSKRPIIPSRYALNRELLGLMTAWAQDNDINLAYYVIPLNPRSENPYVASEYAAFKVWVSDFAARNRVPFANLEDAVPASDWGEFMGGPDFKHFRGTGHRLTAAAVEAAFADQLNRLAGLSTTQP